MHTSKICLHTKNEIRTLASHIGQHFGHGVRLGIEETLPKRILRRPSADGRTMVNDRVVTDEEALEIIKAWRRSKGMDDDISLDDIPAAPALSAADENPDDTDADDDEAPAKRKPANLSGKARANLSSANRDRPQFGLVVNTKPYTYRHKESGASLTVQNLNGGFWNVSVTAPDGARAEHTPFWGAVLQTAPWAA